MSRRADPKIKQHLLEKCLEGAIKRGSLSLSIHEYADIVDTSARMLIYHFGSKADLDERLTLHLDEMMRQEVARFFDELPADRNALLELWDHFTGNSKLKRLALLSLTVTLGPKPRPSFRKGIEKQTTEWIRMIRKDFGSDQAAETALILAQGAMIDFFMTGNKDRGRRCLKSLSADHSRA